MPERGAGVLLLTGLRFAEVSPGWCVRPHNGFSLVYRLSVKEPQLHTKEGLVRPPLPCRGKEGKATGRRAEVAPGNPPLEQIPTLRKV